jgi:hypothetical protein
MMAKEYTVKRIRELTRLTETGDLEKFYRIEAVTTKGTQFSVDIPESQSRPDAVQTVLAARAKELDAIKGL